MNIEIKHRFNASVLFKFECDSIKFCLQAAVKAGAYLGGADLRGADLRDADLVVGLGFPNGWSAFAWLRDGAIRVQVGCRDFTLAESRKYWKGKANRREVLAALNYAEQIAKLRKWDVR